ncbi:MAG: hypothetical protein IPL99_19925 [Candidatus Competibacteraceae bacterium]|nr:hypothetical protein [Candidatus Competibacteraceae bacterium]
MRLVMLLLVLAVIGITLVQMLNHKPPVPAIQQEAFSNPALPTVPTRPQDVKAFERDMNRFIQDTAKQRTDQENAQ